MILCSRVSLKEALEIVRAPSFGTNQRLRIFLTSFDAGLSLIFAEIPRSLAHAPFPSFRSVWWRHPYKSTRRCPQIAEAVKELHTQPGGRTSPFFRVGFSGEESWLNARGPSKASLEPFDEWIVPRGDEHEAQAVDFLQTWFAEVEESYTLDDEWEDGLKNLDSVRDSFISMPMFGWNAGQPHVLHPELYLQRLVALSDNDIQAFGRHGIIPNVFDSMFDCSLQDEERDTWTRVLDARLNIMDRFPLLHYYDFARSLSCRDDYQKHFLYQCDPNHMKGNSLMRKESMRTLLRVGSSLETEFDFLTTTLLADI